MWDTHGGRPHVGCVSDIGRETKCDTHGDDDNNYNEHSNHSSENCAARPSSVEQAFGKAKVDGKARSMRREAKWCASRESNPGPSLGKRG